MDKAKRYGLLGLKALLTAAFAFAAFGKLTGNEMMIAVFDAIGWGQWFRVVTGLIELGAAALLWVPGVQALGAAVLVVTMLAAAGFHLLVLGPSMVPALVLGALAGVVLYAHRDQVARVTG